MRRYNISAKGNAIRELSLNTAKPKAILYLFYFYILSPVPLTNTRDRRKARTTASPPAPMTHKVISEDHICRLIRHSQDQKAMKKCWQL